MQNRVGLALSRCSSVDPGTRHRIILTWRAQPACLWPMLRQRQFCHCPAAPVRTQLLARPCSRPGCAGNSARLQLFTGVVLLTCSDCEALVLPQPAQAVLKVPGGRAGEMQ